MDRIQKPYYQDVKNLMAELNLQAYTDEFYNMMLDNPDYFDLLFPMRRGSLRREHEDTQGVKN